MIDMKVKDLITMLEKMNPEAEVLEFNEDDRAYFPTDDVEYIDNENQYISLRHNPYSMCFGYVFENGKLIAAK